jgi:oligopeptide/dipeptide ABC transporter ATP-binding protein
LGYIAGGLLKPTKGSICLNQQDIGQCRMNITAADIQFIFQDISGSLNPKWLIKDIIAEPLINLKTPKQLCEKMSEKFMEHVGLSAEYLDAYPHELSGGQRQRVSIARAMVTNPKLIICDEPFSALDVSVQTQIINLLLKLKKKFGLTYLIISHDLALMEYMCNSIGVMYLGKIVEEALPAKHLFKKPLHPYSQGLLKSFLFPDPNKQRIDQIEILAGEVPNPVKPQTGCAFYPRCKHRMKICSHQEPLMREVESRRRVACHLFSA